MGAVTFATPIAYTRLVFLRLHDDDHNNRYSNLLVGGQGITVYAAMKIKKVKATKLTLKHMND